MEEKGLEIAARGASMEKGSADGSHVDESHESLSSNKCDNETPRRDWRFWAVFPPLCTSTLVVALEGTVVSTALPSINKDLDAGDLYVWFSNGYFLTFTALVPIYAQLAQVFGRRWPMIIAVALFALGSGISGGASSSAMLLAGRIIQGCGGGGIGLLTQIIISDLVPVRERAKFMSIVFASFSLGAALGPFVGGALVQYVSWRWVFYINLPIAGVSLVLLYLFLQVKFIKQSTVKETLGRIDFVGNAMLIASVTSILIALSFGGARYPWSSWHVLVPLLLGFAGIFLFFCYESSRFCIVPTLPPRLFASNRTTTIALILSFEKFLLAYWILFFLPVYFQGVLLVSTARSGVLLLPASLCCTFIAIIVGPLLSKTGRYKPIHIISSGLLTLGTGLMIRLDATSSMAEYVIFQCLAGLGWGTLVATVLPAVQADLPESDVSVATAAWGFLRANGGIWGVSIPGAIFNSQIQQHLKERIQDPEIIATLSNGLAYSHVSGSYLRDLPQPLRGEVVDVYTRALRVVWIVATAFAGLAFVLTFFEKEVPLRTTVKSDYGLKERKSSTPDDVEKAECVDSKENEVLNLEKEDQANQPSDRTKGAGVEPLMPRMEMDW